MPTYPYKCKKCGRRFEKTMTLGEHERHGKPPCPKCSSRSVEQLPARFEALTNKKT